MRIAVMDLETTGVPAEIYEERGKGSRPPAGYVPLAIEIAAQIIDEDGNPGEVFERRIRVPHGWKDDPKNDNPHCRKALQTNHTTWEELDTGFSLESTVWAFEEFLARNEIEYIYAHSGNFEQHFLDKWNMGRRVICTEPIAHHHMPAIEEDKWISMRSWTERVDLAYPDIAACRGDNKAHTALGDVKNLVLNLISDWGATQSCLPSS